MRIVTLFLTLSAASLLVMLVVDWRIGPRAEFLNAFSVLERLLGREPTAGVSAVARRIGPWGELAAVLAANLAVGGVLTGIARLFTKA